MSTIDRLFAFLTPYECLGCTAEGDLLCMSCIQQLTSVPECCHNCRKPSAGSLTCPTCTDVSNLYRVLAGASYSGVAKALVWKLKFAGARAVARLMAARLVPLLGTESEFIVVPVPTATDRVRGRGYDQAKLLARELSRRSRLPYLDCLARSGHTHQLGAARGQRLRQLQGAFRVRGAQNVRGVHILLVDDVLTTGATLETAARLLLLHGAERISAVVFAQA